MMTAEEKSDLTRFIAKEISRQMNILLNAVTENAQTNTEDVSQLFPGMATQTGRPTVYPYGLCSRAPNGTLSFVARVGDHAGSRYVIGHRDANRPTLNPGETAVYNNFGLQVRLEDGFIRFGTPTSDEPYVLGNILNSFLQSLVSLIVAHSHAAPGAPPSNALAFTTLADDNLDNNAILSTIIVGE